MLDRCCGRPSARALLAVSAVLSYRCHAEGELSIALYSAEALAARHAIDRNRVVRLHALDLSGGDRLSAGLTLL